MEVIIEKLIEIDCEIKFNSNEDYIDEMALKLDWLLYILYEYLNFEFRPEIHNDIFGVN